MAWIQELVNEILRTINNHVFTIIVPDIVIFLNFITIMLRLIYVLTYIRNLSYILTVNRLRQLHGLFETSAIIKISLRPIRCL